MSATTPTTPAKTTPESIMDQAKSKIKNQAGFSLLVDSADIGIVIRPVKIVKLQTSINQLVSVTDQQSQLAAEGQIQQTLKQLQAKIVASGEQVRTYSETEKGPYIELPLPEKLKDTLKINYSSADMGQALVGLSFGQDFINNLGKANEVIKKSAIGTASYVIRTLIAGLSSGTGALGAKIAGNIPNPFSTAIFERVSPRNFSFSWTIQPKNVDESVRLKEVINVLRYYSLPNPSADRLLLAVPYEWILSFTGTNFLYSFSRCVMTDLDIDYSPNGMNVFMSETYAPQAVTITVSFQEIYPLDKQVVDGSNSSMTPLFTVKREAGLTGAPAAPKPNNAAAAASKKVQEARAAVKAAEEAVNRTRLIPVAGPQKELESARENLAKAEAEAAAAAPGG